MRLGRHALSWNWPTPGLTSARLLSGTGLGVQLLASSFVLVARSGNSSEWFARSASRPQNSAHRRRCRRCQRSQSSSPSHWLPRPQSSAADTQIPMPTSPTAQLGFMLAIDVWHWLRSGITCKPTANHQPVDDDVSADVSAHVRPRHTCAIRQIRERRRPGSAIPKTTPCAPSRAVLKILP